MKSNQSQYHKPHYQVKAPPNFSNFYTRLAYQNNKQKSKNSMATNNFDKYKVGNMSNKTASSISNSARNTQQSKSNAAVQYRRFLCDTNNVFFEERQEAKKIKFIETYKPIINVSLFIILSIWLALFFIRPFTGVCPPNADCGVYIACHQGYILKDGLCFVSQQIKLKASLICQAVVANLKIQFGNQDCLNGVQKTTPIKKINQVYEEYQVSTNNIEEEINTWLQDHKNQNKFSFNYKFGQITPKTKQFSVYCKFKKVVGSEGLYLYLLGFLGLIIALVYYVRIKLEKNRAKKIFDYLKRKIQKQTEIVIKLSEIQSKFGKIYSSLWQVVDKLRIQDKSIVFYEDQHLHWVMMA